MTRGLASGLASGLHKRQWADFTPVLDVWGGGASVQIVTGITNASSVTCTVSNGAQVPPGGWWGIPIGANVTGTNVVAGTTVKAISGNTLTLTQATTGTVTTLAFGNQTPNLGTPASGPQSIGRYLYVPEMNLCHYEFIVAWGGLVVGPSATWTTNNTITTAGNFWTYFSPGMMVFDTYPPTKIQPNTYVVSINAAGTSMTVSQPTTTGATATLFGQGHGGAGYYMVKLPIPCRLQLGGATVISTPNIADRFIGTGHVAQTFLENPNVPVHFMPGDYNGLTYGGRRQDWAQAFCPYVRTQGSATVTAATTSTVVFPFALRTAPLGGHIQIGFKGSTGTAAWWFSSLTNTGFTITFSASTTVTFDWVLMQDNSLLVGSQAPYALGTAVNGGNSNGQYDSIKGCLSYETDT